MSETKSYEDVLEDNREQIKGEVEDVPVIKFEISPNYKGKNPKSPEELAKIREQKRARRAANKTEDDMVNHPAHYKVGKYEAIDIIGESTKELTGIFAVDQANALKYLLRWNKKGTPIRDLKKSIWYIQHMINKLEEVEAQKEFT